MSRGKRIPSLHNCIDRGQNQKCSFGGVCRLPSLGCGRSWAGGGKASASRTRENGGLIIGNQHDLPYLTASYTVHLTVSSGRTPSYTVHLTVSPGRTPVSSQPAGGKRSGGPCSYSTFVGSESQNARLERFPAALSWIGDPC